MSSLIFLACRLLQCASLRLLWYKLLYTCTRVLFFDFFCLGELWGAPEAARTFRELVFRIVLVPGLTSGHGAMYTECGDHRASTFELFQVLQSRTCGLCCRQLSDGVGTNVGLEATRRRERSFAWNGAVGGDAHVLVDLCACSKLKIARYQFPVIYTVQQIGL